MHKLILGQDFWASDICPLMHFILLQMFFILSGDCHKFAAIYNHPVYEFSTWPEVYTSISQTLAPKRVTRPWVETPLTEQGLRLFKSTKKLPVEDILKISAYREFQMVGTSRLRIRDSC